MNYSVVSCIFGNYEKIREVINPDPESEYILVTDNKELSSDTWRIVYNPITYTTDYYFKSFYVKTHLFEFTNTDRVLWIDHSTNILDGISIKKYFIDILDDYDRVELLNLNPLAHNNIRVELQRWINDDIRGMSSFNINIYDDIIDSNKNLNNGMVQTTIYAMNNTDTNHKASEDIWYTLIYFRLNSSFYPIMTAHSLVINKYYYNSDRLAIYYPTVLWSKLFKYCYHSSDHSQLQYSINSGCIDYYYVKDKPKLRYHNKLIKPLDII